MRNKQILMFLFLFIFLFGINDAFASGGIAELASPLEKLLDTLKGPIAKVLLVFMLILTAVGYYFSRGEELSGIFKALIGVIFIMGVIALATSLVATFFPSVSGALI